ncbi:hypothetical protein SDC49_20530 [Lactobacillus sp. R2/2]|nr:hypothetical protein [Lactobacillus sp. R2/2]
MKTAFAPQAEAKAAPATEKKQETGVSEQNQPKLAVDGLMIIGLGFTLCFTFYIFLFMLLTTGSMC